MHLLQCGWTPINPSAIFTLSKSESSRDLTVTWLLVHLRTCPLLMSPSLSPASCALWFPGRCSFLMVSRPVALRVSARSVAFLTSVWSLGDEEKSGNVTSSL